MFLNANTEIIVKFFRYVDKQAEGCWQWTGPLKWSGYGRFNHMYRGHAAHRWLYEQIYGLLPKDTVLDHLCRNRQCVNPKHLEPVTHKVNILRGSGASAECARKTHCKNGHPLEGDNLYPSELRKGKRCCTICIREKDRQDYHKNKEKILQERKEYYAKNREAIRKRRKETGANVSQ